MSYNIQRQSTMQNDMGQVRDIQGKLQKSVNTVLETINNNKLLIGSLVAAGGAAIFILTTDSGKRLRTEIEDRAEDLYDFVSDQVKNGFSQSRDVINKMLSRTPEEEASKGVDIAA